MAHGFEEIWTGYIGYCQGIVKRGSIVEAEGGFVCVCEVADEGRKGMAEVGGRFVKYLVL